MRPAAVLAVVGLFSGCAGLLHAPAEGRPKGQSAETALLHGMNPDFLAPTVHRIQVEVDWTEGWAPGEAAVEALKEELRRWAPPGTEISVRVDPPIPLQLWRGAEDSFAHTAVLVRASGDPTVAEADVSQLHVVYLPTLQSVGQRAALGVTLALPHGPRAEDMRATVLLCTERIQKIAALWIGPRKVERTVLVHEFGHVLGLVADGEHQHRGDPSHCRNSSCLMVSSMNKGAAVVGAPRAIFLGGLPTAYCPVCRGDLEAARKLFAATAQDSTAWARVEAERRAADRNARIGFLLESGDVEAAVTELQSPDHDPGFGGLWTLARTLRGLGRGEQALEAGQRLVPLDAQGRTVESRAGPLMDMGRWEEALQEIQDAKVRGTYDSRLEIRALLGAGRVQEADDRLRLEAEKATDPWLRTSILHQRLWLWRAAGDPERALELLGTIPRRELKADRELVLEAARLLRAEGRSEEARALLDPLAREKKPKHRGEVATIARARALSGDEEGALRAVERRSEWFNPGDLLLLRGRILAALGQTEGALDALEEARRQGVSPEVPCLDPDLAGLRRSERFQALYRCGLPVDTDTLGASEGLQDAQELAAAGCSTSRERRGRLAGPRGAVPCAAGRDAVLELEFTAAVLSAKDESTPEREASLPGGAPSPGRARSRGAGPRPGGGA